MQGVEYIKTKTLSISIHYFDQLLVNEFYVLTFNTTETVDVVSDSDMYCRAIVKADHSDSVGEWY